LDWGFAETYPLVCCWVKAGIMPRTPERISPTTPNKRAIAKQGYERIWERGSDISAEND
jgi:hypothetical protein